MAVMLVVVFVLLAALLRLIFTSLARRDGEGRSRRGCEAHTVQRNFDRTVCADRPALVEEAFAPEAVRIVVAVAGRHRGIVCTVPVGHVETARRALSCFAFGGAVVQCNGHRVGRDRRRECLDTLDPLSGGSPGTKTRNNLENQGNTCFILFLFLLVFFSHM